MMEKVQMYCVLDWVRVQKYLKTWIFLRIDWHPFLEWKIPLSLEENWHYAERMCRDIHHKNPILLGVSFGGVMVQEMAKVIDTKKIILVSILNLVTTPQPFGVIRNTKAYNYSYSYG